MKKVNLIAAVLLAIGLTAGLFGAAPTEPPAQVVSVTVDHQAPSVVSKLEIGLTHTQAMWENGHPEAVARVKKQLEEARIRYQNQHIMGWGAQQSGAVARGLQLVQLGSPDRAHPFYGPYHSRHYLLHRAGLDEGQR